MNKKEILEGLRSGKPYDFIACNYYRMDKEELKDIILELLAQFEGEDYKELVKQLIENLIEFKSWNEDEE